MRCTRDDQAQAVVEVGVAIYRQRPGSKSVRLSTDEGSGSSGLLFACLAVYQ